MVRTALLFALLAACGSSQDERPLTIDYVTDAVLAPTCGSAECHSTFRQSRGDIFDTVKGARASLIDNGLVTFDSPDYNPAKPEQARLIQWVTQIDPYGLGIGRMPYDQPMPNEDIIFLENFIAAGAPGAQCDPAMFSGFACNNTTQVRCTVDWEFGEVTQQCASQCVNGACQ